MIRSSDPILIALIENAASTTLFGRTSFKQDKAERNGTKRNEFIIIIVLRRCQLSGESNEKSTRRNTKTKRTENLATFGFISKHKKSKIKPKRTLFVGACLVMGR